MHLAALGIGGLVVSALLAAGGGPGPEGPGRASFGLAQARAFAEFPLYDAGERFEGLPLTAVLRRDDTADFVSFVYGECAARDDQGCAPPLEIQAWPACKRNLGLYDSSLPGTPVPERVTVRAVAAGFFEDGDRLELQTGRSTVVVFGGSRSRNLRVAASLRPVGKGPSSAPLPAPDPGAVAGSLRC